MQINKILSIIINFLRYFFFVLMQFWSPYFEKSELLIPYFKSQLFRPPILVFLEFWCPNLVWPIFLLMRQNH
jgi:hypothetical protein